MNLDEILPLSRLFEEGRDNADTDDDDDFDGEEKKYPESSGGLDEQQAFGGQGRSMLCFYEKGSRGVGVCFQNTS